MTDRCQHVEPGLGRCWDDTGKDHGHHFRPYRPEPALTLSVDEAREWRRFMRHQYLNKNSWPLISDVYDRLERVIA